jgi:uncharacterized protein YbgA (DUF1722 family)
VRIHTVHKYLLLAHSPKHYKVLGHLVAQIKRYEPGNYKEKYIETFKQALSVIANSRKNANVMQHLIGFLKSYLDQKTKVDIIKVIENYREEMVPRIVPITLIRHNIELTDIEYIKDQVFLDPHPDDLMLRNHV